MKTQTDDCLGLRSVVCDGLLRQKHNFLGYFTVLSNVETVPLLSLVSKEFNYL